MVQYLCWLDPGSARAELQWKELSRITYKDKGYSEEVIYGVLQPPSQMSNSLQLHEGPIKNQAIIVTDEDSDIK